MPYSRAGCSATGNAAEEVDLTPAQGEDGLVGYGLGIERYGLPGGIELVGHLGCAAGYRSFVGRVRPLGVTLRSP